MTVVDHDPHVTGDVLDTLAVVRDNALRLLAGFSTPPSALRITVGGVTVEAEWPQSVVASAGWRPEVPVAQAQAPATSTAPAQILSATQADPTVWQMSAPTVGVFYRAPEPGAKPFVDVGDQVRVGQQVGIVEAMKLMIPVNADADGTITEVLKGTGDSVEYGEPLFAYLPA
jgi:acetyl-CoA carboxylase biotin carboxyl carrier protein